MGAETAGVHRAWVIQSGYGFVVGRLVPLALAVDNAGFPVPGAVAHLPLLLGGPDHGGLGLSASPMVACT